MKKSLHSSKGADFYPQIKKPKKEGFYDY